MARTLVVAEPGSTAEGRPEAFYRLIDLAASIGCDVFKNQWVSDPWQLCLRRDAPEYKDAYRYISYPIALHEDLASRTRSAGMKYACSLYLPDDVRRVAGICDYVKVASFEAEDRAMRTALWYYRHKTIVSLGMGADRDPWLGYFARLHCVSAYSTPTDEINLGRMRGLDGLSDHTRHPWTGALAVAAGAKVIEFHVRLADTSPNNADYAVARSPEEARVYIENIRLAEQMMGDGVKRVMPSEEKMLRYRVKA